MKINIGHYDTQFRTGHGNLTEYLSRFRHPNSTLGKFCGVEDTPGHVFYHCLKYNEERIHLVTELKEKEIHFNVKRALRTGEGFKTVSSWFKRIKRHREDEAIG